MTVDVTDGPLPAEVLAGIGVLGVAGAGSFGSALARRALDAGLPPDRLLVSHSGSAAGRARLLAAGLGDALTSNDAVLAGADVLLVTTRQPDVAALGRVGDPTRTVVGSAVAGMTRALLEPMLGAPVTTFIASGPDTVLDGTGLASLTPEQPVLRRLLVALGLRVVPTPDEEEFAWSVVAVCLPAALLLAPDRALTGAAVAGLAVEHPVLAEVYDWALGVLPTHLDDAGRAAYIDRMSARGGITEAITTAVRSGLSFADALLAGRARLAQVEALAGAID